MESRGRSLQFVCTGLYRHLAQRGQIISNFLDDGKKKNSIAVLDGVRAVACLAIIIFHMNLLARFSGIWNPPLQGIGAFFSAVALFGESGVILFFVLSGFLLFLPFVRSMLSDSPWPSVPRFYIRRVFRIVPGYYVALFLMLIFLAPEYFKSDHSPDLWLFLTFRMDFPLTFQRVNGPFWTLALEFQYYILLPLLAWGMALLVRRGAAHWRLIKMILCLILIVVWGVWTRFWGASMRDGGDGFLSGIVPSTVIDIFRPYVYGATGKYLEVFAIGMLIAAIYSYGKQIALHTQFVRYMRQGSPVIFMGGLGLLGFITLWHFYQLFPGQTLNFLDPYQAFLTNYSYMFQPLVYAISYGLCILALRHGTSWLKRPFEWNPLRWVGLISYSLYMWHYPIILLFLSMFLPKFQLQHWSQPAQYLVYWLWILLTAFPLSIALYKLIEVPGIQMGEKLCQRLEQRRKHRGRQIQLKEEPVTAAVAVLQNPPETGENP
ncbi:acyltransferase family protein [Dictyobacter alpinus]|nr:acyltransferase [Dictyobacter alpinus]